MLKVRSAAGGFICLACRSRPLPYGHGHRAHALAPPPIARLLLGPRIPRRQYSANPPDDDVSSSDHHGCDLAGGPPAEGHPPPLRTPNGKRIRLYRSSKGEVVYPDTQDLSINILGKPAAALIMKPYGQAKKRTKVSKRRGKEKPAKKPKEKLAAAELATADATADAAAADAAVAGAKKPTKVTKRGRKRKLAENTEETAAAAVDAAAVADFGADADAGAIVDAEVDVDASAASTDATNTPDGWAPGLGHTKIAKQSEIQEYIDGIRPTNTAVISQSEYDSLMLLLFTGFTKNQLSKYARAISKDDPGSGTDPTPWVLEKLPWQSESKSKQLLGPGAVTAATARAVAQAQLVQHIICDCWGLSVKELQLGMGYLDLRLRDLEFSLLMGGSRPWLEQISRLYLDEYGGRIELKGSDNLVRITAPKTVAETVVEKLNEVLRSTVVHTIDLNTVTHEDIRGEALDQLERLTDSYIRLDEKSRRLFVFWIPPRLRDYNSTWEQVPDKVIRFLRGAYTDTPTSSLAVVPEQEPTSSQARLVVDHGVRYPSPPWHALSGLWARWLQPRTFSNEIQESPLLPDLVLPSNALKWEVDPWQWKFKSTHTHDTDIPFSSPSVLTHWSRRVTDTKALFGHILHATPKDTLFGSRLNARPQRDSPRIFSPVLPPVGSYEKAKLADTARSELVLRLVPSLNHDAHKTAPVLELSLHVEGHTVRDLECATLFAVHEEHNSDILFPTLPVDVRLAQRQSSRLMGPDLVADVGLKPLRDFYGDGSFDLKNHRFNASAHIRELSLPASLFKDAASDTGNEQPAVLIDYEFAGIEHRRHVDMVAGDCNVLYTSIVELGQPGRDRAELSLYPGKALVNHEQSATEWSPDAEPVSLEDLESSKLGFLRDIVEFAKGERVAWMGDRGSQQRPTQI